ncbi:hypothetical protein Naga_102608g1, partial [Nannochloropsis gaditana]
RKGNEKSAKAFSYCFLTHASLGTSLTPFFPSPSFPSFLPPSPFLQPAASVPDWDGRTLPPEPHDDAAGATRPFPDLARLPSLPPLSRCKGGGGEEGAQGGVRGANDGGRRRGREGWGGGAGFKFAGDEDVVLCRLLEARGQESFVV